MATLKVFDVCNQEKIQVVWYSYLRNDTLFHYLNKLCINAVIEFI